MPPRRAKVAKAKTTTTLAETATTAARIAAAISKEDNNDAPPKAGGSYNEYVTAARSVEPSPLSSTTTTSKKDNNKRPYNNTTKSSGCLHCHNKDGNIQVSCDECHSYICHKCHWCHEFQANHEIRVCDRCDAFYCKACDEMDQCDDCSEVVCASCSTLLSCKFCGGGLCEECATACGRCGIVLCARDAKFAVECDTCKLSYCLVCLASGTKDPCVRCGHRPSKRVEQLVHLRLKSIYKAFKQSGASSSSNNNRASSRAPRGDDDGDDDDHSTDNEDGQSSPRLGDSNDVGAVLQAAAAAAAGINTRKRPTKTSTTSPLEKFRARQAEADAAAASLLAELEEEEIKAETANKSKKKKKKRKKERQQAKKEEKKKPDEEEEEDEPKMTDQDAHKANFEEYPKEASEEDEDETKHDEEEENASEDEQPYEETLPEVDSVEKELCEMVEAGDVDGIEALLASLRGIPGRAALRKNAKKALKRLKQEADETAAAEAAAAAMEENEMIQVDYSSAPASGDRPGASTPANQSDASASGGYKPPEPLLKLVSHTHRPVGQAPSGLPRSRSMSTSGIGGPSQSGATRAECVMHMAPSVVGWVIGKGGQRIRELMDESGSKVWIDQDSMGAQEPRIVYVSGNRKSVDAAVRMIKELVTKAPVGGAGGGTPVSTTGPTHVGVGASKPPLLPDGELQGAESPKGPVPLSMRSSSMDDTRVAAAKSSFRRAESAGPLHYAKESSGPSAHPSRTDTSGKRDWSVHEMTCEPRFVPLLIGRRGWTIKHIQDSSGARVDIDQTVTPRKIKISGKSHCVRSAIRMVSDVLSYPHAQLHYHGDQQPVAPEKSQAQAPAVPEVADRGKTTLDGEEILKAALKSSLQNEDGTGRHSPPPSSLNIKSTISASSSLSSTPEPSMSSSGPQTAKRPPGMQPGAILPPDSLMQPTSLTGGQMYPQPEQPELGLERNLGAMDSAGVVGNEAAPLYQQGVAAIGSGHGNQQGMSHEQRYSVQAPAAPGYSQSQPQSTFQGTSIFQDALRSNVGTIGGQNIGQPTSLAQDSTHLQGSRALNFMSMQNQSKEPPPMHQPSTVQPPQLLFERRSAAPARPAPQNSVNLTSGDGGPSIFGSASNSDAFGATSDLWGGDAGRASSGLGAAGQGGFLSSTTTQGYRPEPVQATNARQTNSNVPLGYAYAEPAQTGTDTLMNRGLPSGGENTGTDFGFGHRQSAQSSRLHQSQDDANLVDNLFGPPSGNGTDQNLLGGLQNLSINSEAIGGWGSSIPGWGLGGQGGDAAPGRTAPTGQQGTSASGHQPLHPQQQQQQRSRINW